jgi:hypothetical protein
MNEQKAVQEGGEELEPAEPDFEEVAREEKAKTDGTTATPSELAGVGSGAIEGGHNSGPAEL